MPNTMTPWTKPQLIVLARGTPEEAVLTGCKEIVESGETVPMNSPDITTQNACNSGESPTQNCGACQGRSGS